MTTRTHKRKKQTRNRGRGRGTCGSGSRKNKRKSGHRGGKGMAGTGKRADHKKTLLLNLYGNDYFGKQGITSKGTKRDTRKRINVGQIEENLNTFIKKKIAEKKGSGFSINLSEYKILGEGTVTKPLHIKALAASSSAFEKVTKAGGSITVQKTDKATSASETE